MNALDRICADTLAEVERRKRDLPMSHLRDLAAQAPAPRGFRRALMEMSASGRFALIAEIKKASPSGGMIRPDFDPARLAEAYLDGGAACLSVLTDEPYFHGLPEHLHAARTAVELPVLRKDFMLDPWQIHESRMMGADCILLIMAALSDDQAIELEQVARALDMDVLVEVHDRAELERALGLQTKLMGINSRNLKTLKTDLATVFELAPLVPPDHIIVAESGLRENADLKRLAEIGVTCFLVGESLMRQTDVATATRTLLAA